VDVKQRVRGRKERAGARKHVCAPIAFRQFVLQPLVIKVCISADTMPGRAMSIIGGLSWSHRGFHREQDREQTGRHRPGHHSRVVGAWLELHIRAVGAAGITGFNIYACLWQSRARRLCWIFHLVRAARRLTAAKSKERKPRRSEIRLSRFPDGGVSCSIRCHNLAAMSF